MLAFLCFLLGDFLKGDVMFEYSSEYRNDGFFDFDEIQQNVINKYKTKEDFFEDDNDLGEDD